MKKTKLVKISLLVGFFVVPLVFVGCGDGYNQDEIKNDFCGTYLDAKYCKCAFHGDYCKEVGMDKGEAKTYVYGRYDEWTETGVVKLQDECAAKNGFVVGNTCIECGEDEVAGEGKCMKNAESE